MMKWEKHEARKRRLCKLPKILAVSEIHVANNFWWRANLFFKWRLFIANGQYVHQSSLLNIFSWTVSCNSDRIDQRPNCWTGTIARGIYFWNCGHRSSAGFQLKARRVRHWKHVRSIPEAKQDEVAEDNSFKLSKRANKNSKETEAVTRRKRVEKEAKRNNCINY